MSNYDYNPKNDWVLQEALDTLNRDEMELVSYPLPDVVISYFGITKQELMPYLNDSRAWEEIFDDIMEKKRQNNP